MAATAKRKSKKRTKNRGGGKPPKPQRQPSSAGKSGSEQAARPEAADKHGFDPVQNDRIIALLGEAIEKHQTGDTAAAAEMYRTALEIDPDHPHALHLLGVVQHQRGENAQAVELIERSLARNPNFADAQSNLGAALFALGRLSEAAEHFRRATELNPMMADAHSNLAAILKEQGKVKAAIESYQAAHKVDPGAPRFIKRLANLYLAYEQFEDAADWFGRYIALEPDDAEVLNCLGNVHERLYDLEKAEYFCRRAVELCPDSPEINNNIATVLTQMGRADEAEVYFKRSVDIAPETWGDQVNLAKIYSNSKQFSLAFQIFDRLLESRPDDPEIWADYGAALTMAGHLDKGKDMLHRAIELKPDFAEAHNFLGTNRYEARENKEAIDAFKESLKYDAQNTECLNSVCFPLLLEGRYDEAYLYAKTAATMLDYHPTKFTNPLKIFTALCDLDAAEEVDEIWENLDQLPPVAVSKCALALLQRCDNDDKVKCLVDAHRRWGEDFSNSSAQLPLPPLPKHKPGSKIRLGFMSSDLRSHSVGKAVRSLFEIYDRDRFEIHCYTPWEDAKDGLQLKFKEWVTSFKVFPGLSRRDLAEFIRKDEIDILFELNGFTLHNRMGSMTYRAAPVQIFWLGYPFTIGLPEIDYILLDDFCNPENEDWLCEKPLLMPESWVAFGELDDVAIDPELPFERNGMITFGTMNNPNKFTRPMIELWCEIMKRVPDSRFLLVRPECASLTLCSNLTEEFARNGIGADRIYFVNNKAQGLQHLLYYDEMDVTLDTYPVTGGNTTCDALWMGAPVVTKYGPAMHQRLCYALMNHIGLGDLCTTSDEEYVRIAVALANDHDRLRGLRFGLRQQFLDSPLGQTERFAENFQNVMEDLARKHGLV